MNERQIEAIARALRSAHNAGEAGYGAWDAKQAAIALAEELEALEWSKDFTLAPWDGTECWLTDGKYTWLSSREHGPMVGGMPTTGHDWYIPEGHEMPTHWAPGTRPKPPKEG